MKTNTKYKSYASETPKPENAILSAQIAKQTAEWMANGNTPTICPPCKHSDHSTAGGSGNGGRVQLKIKSAKQEWKESGV